MMIDQVEIRLLGPVEVHIRTGAQTIGPPQQRLVLAALAADAGRPVTVQALLDRVWDNAPRNARHTLHVLITRLRGMLRHGGVTLVPIDYRSGAYVLGIDPERVDLHRFRRLLSQADDPARRDHDRLETLRQARELWRGEPLAGVAGRWAARVREAWEQQFLDSAIGWARAEVSVGNPRAVVGPLTELTAVHPLVEPLSAALMRALVAVGRIGDALAHYARIRRRLLDELGVEPCAELQHVHHSALRGELRPVLPAGLEARTVAPAQLPPDVADFTGRGSDLRQLDALLGGGRPATAVAISVVSGTAGVGKTALTVHWAHKVAGRFPDGQLYVDLRGYDPDQPMTPAEALARFLTALGVAATDIPQDGEQRAACYRTLIARRRMLLVLDNADSAAQVRPLLPGGGGCAVLVTSRDRLAGLVARDGARRVALDALPPADALALLRRLIGPRADADPAAGRALAVLCARLPLVLRVAAELATSRPGTPLADLVDELADEQHRFDLLTAGDDPRTAVAAVFSWSIRHLAAGVARTFRLLGAHPGPDFDAYAVAALAGTGLAPARGVLERLAGAHLVHPTGPGRYGIHDLLRAYTTQLTSVDGTHAERESALHRMFDYYLSTAVAAVARLYPAESGSEPRVAAPAAPSPELTDPAAARSWLDAERPALVAMAAHAASAGRPGHAVRLSSALLRYLDDGHHHRDALALHTHARDAAQRAGDQCGQAWALLGLGAAHRRLGRPRLASACCHRSLVLFRRLGLRRGEAHALNGLGEAAHAAGDPAGALAHHTAALALAGDLGAGELRARAHAGLGDAHHTLGNPASARLHFACACAIYTALDIPAADDMRARLRVVGRSARA